MVGPFNFDEDESNRLPEEMPIHTPCGLPVELCTCPNAEVKFENGMYVQQPAPCKPGEVHVNLSVPGSEERARNLIASGLRVTEVVIETEDVECPACSWGSDSTLVFTFPADHLPISKFVTCAKCGFDIPLSPELHCVMESLVRRPL